MQSNAGRSTTSQKFELKIFYGHLGLEYAESRQKLGIQNLQAPLYKPVHPVEILFRVQLLLMC